VIDACKIYQSPRQRLSRWTHQLKARYKSKARPQVRALSTYIPTRSLILDVGAHFGYFSKESCRLHGGSCQVYCFEPLDYNHGILDGVLSKCHNVTLSRVAPSDQAGSSRIFVPIENSGRIGPGLAHIDAQQNRAAVVQDITTLPLDHWMADQALNRLDLIKCDVEGAEPLVLSGGRKTLSEYKPALYCEVDDNCTRRLDYTPADLFGSLSDLGYAAQRYDGISGRFSPTAEFCGNSDFLFLQQQSQ